MSASKEASSLLHQTDSVSSQYLRTYLYIYSMFARISFIACSKSFVLEKNGCVIPMLEKGVGRLSSVEPIGAMSACFSIESSTLNSSRRD